MIQLSEEEFEREAEAFDEAAFSTPDIDATCSSSDWILPCRTTWSPRAAAHYFRLEGGYAAFVEVMGHPSLWTGLDVCWQFACPLVGGAQEEFGRECGPLPWRALFLPGLVPECPAWKLLVHSMGGSFDLRRGEVVARRRASLAGGIDGFLSRRTPKFRRELRRAERRALEAGITIAPGEGDPFPRMLAVEQASWKGGCGEGLAHPLMLDFYRAIAARIGKRGGLRVQFARQGGRDVGYILGAVGHGIYRGFQFSYDDHLSHLSIGSLLQRFQIEALCREGVHLYDLGIDLPYKRSWGEICYTTRTLVALRRDL